MRALRAGVLLAVSSVCAYQITYPGGSQSWTTAGPNFLHWQRVDTDPPTFAIVLINQGTGYNETLGSNIDGTLGIVQCAPNEDWPAGTDFVVNMAQDTDHLDSLLAQSQPFDITQVSNETTTTAAPTQTTVSSSATSSSVASVSSTQTSASPTATSAGSLNVDTQAGLRTAVAVLMVLITNLV